MEKLWKKREFSTALFIYLRLRFGAWVSAEAAALLAAFDDLGLLRTRDAAEAAFFDVCSFFAILFSPPFHPLFKQGIIVWTPNNRTKSSWTIRHSFLQSAKSWIANLNERKMGTPLPF
jgi:hypothetical protein